MRSRNSHRSRQTIDFAIGIDLHSPQSIVREYTIQSVTDVRRTLWSCLHLDLAIATPPLPLSRYTGGTRDSRSTWSAGIPGGQNSSVAAMTTTYLDLGPFCFSLRSEKVVEVLYRRTDKFQSTISMLCSCFVANIRWVPSPREKFSFAGGGGWSVGRRTFFYAYL